MILNKYVIKIPHICYSTIALQAKTSVQALKDYLNENYQLDFPIHHCTTEVFLAQIQIVDCDTGEIADFTSYLVDSDIKLYFEVHLLKQKYLDTVNNPFNEQLADEFALEYAGSSIAVKEKFEEWKLNARAIISTPKTETDIN